MEGRIIEVKDKKLYIEYNNHFKDRPAIVFLHDSLGSVQLWRDFPDRLSETVQCNILAYDRLGYGKSYPMPTHERPVNYMELEADLLNNLLSEMNITEAILFGHSDGGTIALINAAKYPERIKAVICEAGHIFVEDITLKGVYDAWEAYRITNLAERLKKYHGDKVETLFRAWTETWTHEDYRNWNIEPLLKDITAPLLFIQGESDEYGTLDRVEKTIAGVSGSAEKYIISGVGHTPHKEIPELVLEKAAEFIRKHS